MNARTFRPLTLIPLLILFLGACDEIKRVKDIALGTGHSAHELCSRIFVSGEEPEAVIENVLIPKVFPLQWVWSLDIDHGKKTVSVGAPFFNALNNATAFYRETRGCTMTHGNNIESMSDSEIKAIEVPEIAEEAYWPLGELGIDPQDDLSANKKVSMAIDEMFRERSSDIFEQINTYAVLVVKDGKLVAERYAPNYHVDNRLLGWSISKSITALLLGILHDQGKLSLDDVVALAYQPEAEVKLQHVFNMASGLDYNEDYEGESDVSKMLYTVADASDYAKNRALRYEPGSEFNYSTGDTQILSDIVQRAVGGTPQDAYEFYQRNLFHKLGIRNAVVEHDASGTFIGGARVFMRPRDWAKVGQLMLNEGMWQGEQIVSSEWIKEMLRPSKAYEGYGGQVWLYEAETFGEQFPEDAYVLWGVIGQMIVVVPSQNLVVVRMGAISPFLEEEGIEREIVFDPVLEIIRNTSEQIL